MNKNTTITIIIILAVIGIAWFALNQNRAVISKDLAECIGQRTEYFSQTGCPHCATQKEMFGSNAKYLNEVDCVYASAYCNERNISSTPTWIVNGKAVSGVQSKEELKLLTGCTEE